MYLVFALLLFAMTLSADDLFSTNLLMLNKGLIKPDLCIQFSFFKKKRKKSLLLNLAMFAFVFPELKPSSKKVMLSLFHF